GQAELAPAAGRRPQAPTDRQRWGRGGSCWRPGLLAGTPEPDRQFTPARGIVARLRQRNPNRLLRHTACQIALQPAPFGAPRPWGQYTAARRWGGSARAARRAPLPYQGQRRCDAAADAALQWPTPCRAAGGHAMNTMHGGSG